MHLIPGLERFILRALLIVGVMHHPLAIPVTALYRIVSQLRYHIIAFLILCDLAAAHIRIEIRVFAVMYRIDRISRIAACRDFVLCVWEVDNVLLSVAGVLNSDLERYRIISLRKVPLVRDRKLHVRIRERSIGILFIIALRILLLYEFRCAEGLDARSHSIRSNRVISPLRRRDLLYRAASSELSVILGILSPLLSSVQIRVIDAFIARRKDIFSRRKDVNRALAVIREACRPAVDVHGSHSHLIVAAASGAVIGLFIEVVGEVARREEGGDARLAELVDDLVIGIAFSRVAP